MKTIQQQTLPFGKTLVALSVLAATPVLAQTTSGVLEEIIVTAEHREATLQETQISMAAFNRNAIEQLGISNSLDLSLYVPNLTVQPYVGGRTGVAFTMRGIGNSETLVTFDPAVSVYLDGVLITKQVGNLLDVLDLERIEVLRGPQGTLYGRNTMGGAINYITNKPSDEFGGRVQATVGNYSRQNLKGMVNVPVLGADSAMGELNVKLNAATINRDGIQDNDFEFAPQDEFGTEDRKVYMGQIQWKPVDTLSVLYEYDYSKLRERPQTTWVVNANPDKFYGQLFAPYRENENSRPDGGQWEHIQMARTRVIGQGLTISWDISDTMTLMSLTGKRDMKNLGEADSDGTPIGYSFPNPPIPPAIWTRDDQHYHTISEELRLLGSLWDSKLEYTSGAYYMTDEGDVFNQTYAAAMPSANIGHYKNTAWAAYGQATWHFTEKLDFTGGLRYTSEDRDMEKTLLPGDFDPPIFLQAVKDDPVLSQFIYPKASKDFDNVSWLVSVGYNWTDDVMTYAKVSTGFQSGGFNIRDILPSDFTKGFKDETLISYELGMKSQWVDKYMVNVALFYNDYDDKRVNQFDPVNLVSVQRNAGTVEIYGAEVETLAQLTDHWQVGAQYGYTHKKYKKYEGANGEDLSDNANFPYSPDHSATAHVTYEYALDYGVFSARLDWSYRSDITFLTPKPERNSSGNLALWNANVALDEIGGPGDTKIRVAAWCKNIFDRGYYDFGVNIYDSFGFDINTYGAPRTFGLDLTVDF